MSASIDRRAAGVGEAAQKRFASLGRQRAEQAAGASEGEGLQPGSAAAKPACEVPGMRETIRRATLATRSGSGPPASGGRSAAATSPSADMAPILG